MSATRDFHLGDVLSITTGRLVSPRQTEGVYDILNFMTGDNLFTHQLPRAMEECRPHLLEQHPDLAKVDSECEPDSWEEWLTEQEAEHGSYLAVSPVPKGAHLVVDPLKELGAMVGDDNVIAVTTEDEEDTP